MKNKGRNGTAKSRKNLNTRRKGKSQVLENIESGHHEISADEGNMRKG